MDVAADHRGLLLRPAHDEELHLQGALVVAQALIIWLPILLSQPLNFRLFQGTILKIYEYVMKAIFTGPQNILNECNYV